MDNGFHAPIPPPCTYLYYMSMSFFVKYKRHLPSYHIRTCQSRNHATNILFCFSWCIIDYSLKFANNKLILWNAQSWIGLYVCVYNIFIWIELEISIVWLHSKHVCLDMALCLQDKCSGQNCVFKSYVPILCLI